MKNKQLADMANVSVVKKTLIGAGVMALSAALLAGSAHAQGKGPRASVASATECAVDTSGMDGAFLVVTTTLTNKSSGNTIPETRAGSKIEGTYKDKDTRGQAFESLGTAPVAAGQAIDDTLVLEAEFALCNGNEVDPDVAGARELNGLATIYYGIAGGDEASRLVQNRCTDNPDTLDVDEGGIYLVDVIDAIEAACAMVMVTP